MTTPTFIRFGEDGDMIFNTSEILWAQHEDIKITDQNQHMASPEEATHGKLYCVRLSIRNHTGLLLTCGTPENRIELFNIIANKLQAAVLRRGSKQLVDSSAPTQTIAAPSTGKRSRKRTLEDEVIKPTDDLT